MKKTIFFGLIIALTIGSYAQKSKFQLGAWKYVQMQKVYKDSVVTQLPGKISGGGIKMWTEHHYVNVGQLINNDGAIKNTYGAGTYTLEGNKYMEDIQYHTNPGAVGRKHYMRLELRNDTLFLSNPADEKGTPIYEKNGYTLEKFVRLK
jgi:hypothetical protein